MNQEFDKAIDKYNEFLVALDDIKRQTSHPVLYKLIAFDIIEMQSADLQEQLLNAQEVLENYGYEN